MLNAAWDVCIPVASENALPCYDRDGYNKILENAKPLNDPDGRHLSAFTYLRLRSVLLERCNFLEFEHFVKRMHGKNDCLFFIKSLKNLSAHVYISEEEYITKLIQMHY